MNAAPGPRYISEAHRGKTALVHLETADPIEAIGELIALVDEMAEEALDLGADKPQARADFTEHIVACCEEAERDLREIEELGWPRGWKSETAWTQSVPAFGNRRRPTVLSVRRQS